MTRLACALVAMLTGCSAVTEGTYGGGYGGRSETDPPREAAEADVSSPCIDATGFGGHGCFRCAPTTSDELLSACTTSRFEVFDNEKRIAGFDPSDPRPAIPDLGPTPPPYEGGPSTSGTSTKALPCPIDTKPNPVMVLGATGFPMETIAKAMGEDATLFYLEKGSCEGVASMVLGDPVLSGEIAYYDADGTKNRCVLGEKHPADIALSALFAQSCANQAGLAEPVALPGGIDDFLGPVNPVMFATPATSKERAISAEAAYRVYGMGSAAGVAPWTDETRVFRRRASSGNQQTVALTLGLAPDALRGRDSNGSSNMLHALLEADEPNATLGISSSEIVDVNRDVMKALAYRHYGQPVAFYPDSDVGSLDRKNVRDGHYFMWIPLHVMTRTSGGAPVAASNAVLDPSGTDAAARDAAVKRLVYVMTSRQQAPVASVDLLGAIKRVGNVPQCAMHVKRPREGAPLEPYTPPVSCDCAFEAAHPGTTRADCTACRSSSECPSSKPTCSFGYCE